MFTGFSRTKMEQMEMEQSGRIDWQMLDMQVELDWLQWVSEPVFSDPHLLEMSKWCYCWCLPPGSSSHDSSGPLWSGGGDLDKRIVVRALLQGLPGIRLRVERSREETQLSCAIIVSSRNHQPLFPPEQKLSCSCFYFLLYGINKIKTQRTFHTQIKAVKYTVHVQMLPFKPSVMYEAHLSFMTNSPNTKSLLFTRTHSCVWYKVWTGSKNGFIRQ